MPVNFSLCVLIIFSLIFLNLEKVGRTSDPTDIGIFRVDFHSNTNHRPAWACRLADASPSSL